MLTLSAYRAPINAPMLVPPTMSTGISASTKAFSIPTCDRPLNNKNVYYIIMHVHEDLISRVWVSIKSQFTYLAPPPPSTTPIEVPVRKRAKREKSDILSAFVSICFLYNSIYNSKFSNYQRVFNKCNHIATELVKIESLVVYPAYNFGLCPLG